MDRIRNLQLSELSKALTTKKAAQEILAKFLPSISQAQLNINQLNYRSQHLISKSLLPSDFKDWIPFESTGDGNCLFNSVSILLLGDESLNGVLRLLTVSELFAHSEFYANHPQLADTARASGYSIPAILNIFLSDQKAQDMYNGNENSAARAIEVLAKETAKPFVYSSQFHVLALASVLGKPIHSVYPDIPSSLSIKKAFHGVFYPREALLSDVSGSRQTSDLVAVMWTRIQRSPLHGWRPNHFVPLVKSSTCTPITSYASAVKYGRGMPYEASRGSRSPKPFQSLYDDTRTIKSKRSLSHADHTTSDSTLPAAKEHEFLPKAKNVSLKDFPSVAANQPRKDTSSTSSKTTTIPSVDYESTSSIYDTSIAENEEDRSSSPLPHPKRFASTSKEDEQSKKQFVPQTTKATTTFPKTKFNMYCRPKIHRRKRSSSAATPSIEIKLVDKSQVKRAESESAKFVSYFVSKTPKSSVDKESGQMTSDIPTPDCDSDFEEPEEVLPLVGPGLQWYYQKGANAVANLVRSGERMKNTVIKEDNKIKGLVRGTATGTLNQNVDVLVDKLSLAGSLKQQEHLSTMVSLGRYILENGLLVATQDLAKQYKKMKGLKESNCMESSRLLEIMSNHLNVVQIYIEGKGYITENRGKEVVQLVDSIQNVKRMDQKIVNNKVKQAIGGSYDTILEYLDSKRDRDTLNAVLAEITSANFMANLANVQDKRTFKRSKDLVNLNLELFQDMKKSLEQVKTTLTGEAERRKKNRMLQNMKLEKLRHVFRGRGRYLKS